MISTCAIVRALRSAILNVAVEWSLPGVGDLRGGTRLHSRVGRHLAPGSLAARTLLPPLARALLLFSSLLLLFTHCSSPLYARAATAAAAAAAIFYLTLSLSGARARALVFLAVLLLLFCSLCARLCLSLPSSLLLARPRAAVPLSINFALLRARESFV